jgi:hypothetical protein
MHQIFLAQLEPSGKGARVLLPFDPNEAWGRKERHHVTGSVGLCKIRGELHGADGKWFLNLGPAWVRDNLKPGVEVQVVLQPEGPVLAADLVSALGASQKAKSFFESLPTFYRNNFVRWIEQAKRPETRTKRIAEVVQLCESGRRER